LQQKCKFKQPRGGSPTAEGSGAVELKAALPRGRWSGTGCPLPVCTVEADECTGKPSED
jgi:hypothetical protein